jgi:membrane fusion protein
MSLFRPEALSAQSGRSADGIVVERPQLFAYSTAAALLLGAATVAFGLLGTYSARVPAAGSLRADLGMVTLASSVAGTAQRIAVDEGDRVEAGDVLAEIQSGRAGATGAELSEGIAEQIAARRRSARDSIRAQLALLDERETGLRSQIAGAREERERMRDERTTRERQAQLAREALERARDVQRRGFLSQTQLQQVESEALQRAADVQALERELATAGRGLSVLEQALAELPQQRALQRAQLERELSALDQEGLENAARAEASVKAPVAGLITTRLVDPGQSVQAGQTLFALLPDGAQLEAHLLVPSRAVGFIREGATVQLRYQAFPYQKFGHQQGVVRRVSRSALGPAEQAVLLGEAQTREPLYRVVVTLQRQTVTAYGKPQPLLPGMALEADILLERRRLIEWVFEPLYSLRGTMND